MNRFDIALGRKPEPRPGIKGIDCVDVNKFIDDPKRVDEYTAAMAMVYPHDQTITLGPVFSWFNERRAVERVDGLKAVGVRLDDFMVVVHRVLHDRLLSSRSSLPPRVLDYGGPIEGTVLFTESMEEWRVLAAALFCDDDKTNDTFKDLAYGWRPQTVRGDIQSRRDEVFTLTSRVLDFKQRRHTETLSASTGNTMLSALQQSLLEDMQREVERTVRESLVPYIGERNTPETRRRMEEGLARALGLPRVDAMPEYIREVPGIAVYNPRAIARVRLQGDEEEKPNGTV